MLLFLPVLGVDLFPRSVNQTARHVAGGDAVIVFATAGATATARESDEGFVVLAGLTARRQDTGKFPAGYRALRGQLIQDGQLVDGPSPELLQFTVDAAFASPSAAATVVAARTASGPREWKVQGTGQAYRDW